VAVVDAFDRATDQRPTLALELLLDPPPDPRHVAHVIEATVTCVDRREPAGVPDPVGDRTAEPRAALGPEVVRTGKTEETLREGVVPVHALRRLRDALLVRDHERRVAVVEVGGHLVPDEVDPEVRLEGDLRRRRERAPEDRAELVTDLDVVPVALDGPSLVPVVLLEAVDVGLRPLRERDVTVLLLLAGRGALDADPGVV